MEEVLRSTHKASTVYQPFLIQRLPPFLHPSTDSFSKDLPKLLDQECIAQATMPMGNTSPAISKTEVHLNTSDPTWESEDRAPSSRKLQGQAHTCNQVTSDTLSCTNTLQELLRAREAK
jgi:hypothetical protein